MQIHACGIARKIGPIVETYMLMPEMLIGAPDTATLHAKLAEDLCRSYPLRAMLRDVARSAVQRLAA